MTTVLIVSVSLKLNTNYDLYTMKNVIITNRQK